jgi:hypothetical protein
LELYIRAIAYIESIIYIEAYPHIQGINRKSGAYQRIPPENHRISPENHRILGDIPLFVNTIVIKGL